MFVFLSIDRKKIVDLIIHKTGADEYLLTQMISNPNDSLVSSISKCMQEVTIDYIGRRPLLPSLGERISKCGHK